MKAIKGLHREYTLNTTEIWKMPSTGAATVDPLGMDVVSRWFDELEACP